MFMDRGSYMVLALCFVFPILTEPCRSISNNDIRPASAKDVKRRYVFAPAL